MLKEHGDYFDSLATNASKLFSDPTVNSNNTTKMSSGQQDIKLWKLNNALLSMKHLC